MPSHHLEVLETWLCRVGNAFNPVLRSITTYYHVQPRSGHETAMSGACCLPHFFAAGAKVLPPAAPAVSLQFSQFPHVSAHRQPRLNQGARQCTRWQVDPLQVARHWFGVEPLIVTKVDQVNHAVPGRSC